MCIILDCDGGKRPSRSILQACWDSNPDGAGLMYPKDGMVHGVKGLMTFDDFLAAYAEVPDDAPLCLHFRIGTSGGMDGRVTHPYPITDGELESLHALEWDAPYGIAHNGVLHDQFTDDEQGISDTVAYVMDFVAPLFSECEFEGTDPLCCAGLKALELTSVGSRLLVMEADGEAVRLGYGWNTVAPGIAASNQSWAFNRYRVPARVGWSYAEEVA